MHHSAKEWSAASLGLILSSLAIMAMLLVALFVLDPLKYFAIEYIKGGGNMNGLPQALIGALTPSGYLAITIATIFTLSTVLWEIRTRGVSRGLTEAPRPWFYLLLITVLIWFSQAFIYPGKLLGGDSFFHIARIAFVSDALESGRSLYWNNFWHVGVPTLQFTGPLLFLLGGITDRLVGDPDFATKIILFICQMASGVAMYALLRSLSLSQLPRLLGAMAYAGAWSHMHMLIYKGALPQAITFALLPLAIHSVILVSRSRSWPTFSWSILALTCAALIVNHPTNGGFAGIYLLLFVALGLALRIISARSIPALAGAATAGIGASLFVLLPMIAEQDLSTISLGHQAILSFAVPGIDHAAKLLLWSNGNTGSGSNFDAYVGLTVAILAAIGGYAALRGRQIGMIRNMGLTFLVLFAVSLFLTGAHVRTSTFTLFFLSLLAAAGAEFLLTRYTRLTWLPSILAALVFIDLGSTALQPIARKDKAYFDDAPAAWAELTPSGRLLLTNTWSGEFSVSLWSSPLTRFQFPQIALTHAYSTTLYHNYGAVAVKAAARDLRNSGRLSAETFDQLALADISLIVNDSGTGFGLPSFITDRDPGGHFGPVLKVPASPVIFSDRLIEMHPPSDSDLPIFWDEDFQPQPKEQLRVERTEQFIRQIIQVMALSEDRMQAESIPVRSRPTGWQDEETPTSSEKPRIIAYQVTSDHVYLNLESNHRGYARLSYGWHPSLRVTRNGKPVETAHDALGMIVVQVEEGNNLFEIAPTVSSLRQLTLAISASVLLAIMLIGAWGLLRRSDRATPSASAIPAENNSA